MAASKLKYPLGSPQEHIEMCKTHDLPIDMTCEDCDELICAKCAKTDHKEHEWTTIPTAAIRMRKGLFKFLKRIKEEELPGIDEKIEKTSKQITENKEMCDSEIKKLQKHVDEIVARLIKMQRNNEGKLRDNLEEKNKKLNKVKSELNEKKKEIEEMVLFMEDNNSIMSDYGFIDNQRELSKLLSVSDVDIKDCGHSVRFSKGEIRDEVLDNMTGKTRDLDDINLTETSSFEYAYNNIDLLRALCEDQCYISYSGQFRTDQVNNKGECQYKHQIWPNDICVTDTGEAYFIDYGDNQREDYIGCLSRSGSYSSIICTEPLRPWGICQSVDGGLLVTLQNIAGGYWMSEERSLVRHITLKGDVIREYEYQEDGQTKLFAFPYKITQSRNSDICVVNNTSSTNNELLIMSSIGHIKYVYRGQNLTEYFRPGDVACDSLCNILVNDPYNKQIHVLSPKGEFLKFLLTDNEVNCPLSLSLYKSTLWVGYIEGLVKVFKYSV